MGLDKDPIDPGSHGGTRQHGSQMPITCCMAAAAARSLDGVRGIEDHREALLTDPVERPHVGDQVVVAEGRAALGETEALASRRLQLASDRG